jgi:hypothetical protein
LIELCRAHLMPSRDAYLAANQHLAGAADSTGAHNEHIHSETR